MADGKIIIDTSIDSSGAEKGVKSLGGKLGGLAKTSAVAITGMVVAATTAVATITTLAIKQYAEYEQLVGGVETLFKDSSNVVMDYADNAYKSAGLSANEYMNTITSFTASLLQGLGGDTKKAAEIGNQAVIDMADNANKLGTSMESIQNAYAGFAKSNYTMLDNLRIGYGGTKEEMQRLLSDASKLSGVEYSIGNFSDIINAIHVVQTELGITGTTALEAEKTISGSFSAMKSAWSNMLTAFADEDADFDKVVGNLVESIITFGDNIIPRIKTTLEGIGIFLEEFAWQIPNIIMEILPSLIESGASVVGSLLQGIMSSFGQLIEMGVEISTKLLIGIRDSLPNIIQGAIQMIGVWLQAVIGLLPQILQTGIDIIIQLALGLAQALPELIPMAIDAILTLVMTLLDNIDQIIDAGIQLIIGLAEGLIIALPQLIEKIPVIIDKLLTALNNNLPKLIESGIKLIFMLNKGMFQAIPSLLKIIPELIGSMINYFANMIPSFANVGKNIVQGIWQGISNTAGWLKNKIGDFASSVISSVKGFFGIHSPSKIMEQLIGTNIVKGIGVGIEVETPNLKKDIDTNMSDLVAKMKGVVNYEQSMTTARVVAHNDRLSGGVDEDNKSNKESRQVNPTVVLNIDGREFMRATAPYQDEYSDYYKGRL